MPNSTARRIAHYVAAAAVVLMLAASSPAIAVDTYTVDGAHSFVVFRVGHLGMGAAYGRFRTVSGEFSLGKAGADHRVKIEMPADSVYTGNKKRDDHIKGPDFLNAKQFPKVTFQSRSVRKSGKIYKIKGTLSLHGVTKPVAVRMKQLGMGKDPWGNHRAGFEGKFTIKRSDFGMKKMMGAVGDAVDITLAFEGTKKK